MTIIPTEPDQVRTPSMQTQCLKHPALAVDIRISIFRPAHGCAEYHLSLTPTRYADVKTQLHWLSRAYQWALVEMGLDTSSAVLRRIFSSDPVNQRETLLESPLCQRGTGQQASAISITGQAPAGIAKVALWAYHLQPEVGALNKHWDTLGLCVERGHLTHHWSTQITRVDQKNSFDETWQMLNDYSADLSMQGMTVADHVIRTWFLVRDVDVNYMGLVSARKALFKQWGLVPETHYTASTGIGAEGLQTEQIVHMDAYAVNGIDQAHVSYLKALDHLSPTHIYGVTFERATAVSYRDRKQVFISGTASIDNHGEIVHEGNVLAQLDRTLENINALLSEAGGKLADMSHYLVYLRDLSDATAIEHAIKNMIGDTPVIFLHAPVCRPGWLIEIEGMATLTHHAADCPDF